MDDLIRRQDAIEELSYLQTYLFDSRDDDKKVSLEDVRYAIEQLPSAEPEVIHCKDCKYSKHWYRDKSRCFLWHESGIDVFDDGFCNYAKKEESACGSGELNDETGMKWVSAAELAQADEIDGSVLETVPIFGEDTNDE